MKKLFIASGLMLVLLSPVAYSQQVFTDGVLRITALQVDADLYSVNLNLIDINALTFQVDLASVTIITGLTTAVSTDSTFTAGVLTIPVVEVGNELYAVTMNLVDSSLFIFQLDSANPLAHNPDAGGPVDGIYRVTNTITSSNCENPEEDELFDEIWNFDYEAGIFSIPGETPDNFNPVTYEITGSHADTNDGNTIEVFYEYNSDTATYTGTIDFTSVILGEPCESTFSVTAKFIGSS